jgi:hypothetical protein
MLRRLNDMIGFTVQATDGQVGQVADFWFDDAAWTVRYMVVDTGPWLLGRKVLIAPDALGTPFWDGAILPVDLSQEQVENSPEVDLERPVSRHQLLDLNEHYGWPATWTGAPLLGTTYIGTRPEISVERDQEQQDAEPPSGERHLRSVREVVGYRLEATDGAIGHVKDLFADETAWALRYLVVDTRNWLPGRDVLLATEWINRIGWTDGLVQVKVTKEQVRNSPEYDPEPPVSRDYEANLHGYYGFPGYWV